MSSHQAAVRRSDSWDMDFYLLVVSGVSTRTRALRCAASPHARKPSAATQAERVSHALSLRP
jgi:hypothetical protein